MAHRYAEIHPADLRRLIEQGSPAIVPWGALEWHGDHLPLGLDGIVAEWFASQLADRTSGVLLPGIWLPMTTLPGPFSLQVDTATFKAVVEQTVEGLAGVGFQTIALVTGHYAQGHLAELSASAAETVRRRNGTLRVFAGPPLGFSGDDELLDHAGQSETSQLLHLRPGLVRLDALPACAPRSTEGVLGRDPREGSAQRGAELLSEALDNWQEHLQQDSVEDALALLEAGIQAQNSYRAAYFKTSWEDAILDWWHQRRAADER